MGVRNALTLRPSSLKSNFQRKGRERDWAPGIHAVSRLADGSKKSSRQDRMPTYTPIKLQPNNYESSKEGAISPIVSCYLNDEEQKLAVDGSKKLSGSEVNATSTPIRMEQGIHTVSQAADGSKESSREKRMPTNTPIHNEYSKEDAISPIPGGSTQRRFENSDILVRRVWTISQDTSSQNAKQSTFTNFPESPKQVEVSPSRSHHPHTSRDVQNKENDQTPPIQLTVKDMYDIIIVAVETEKSVYAILNDDEELYNEYKKSLKIEYEESVGIDKTEIAEEMNCLLEYMSAIDEGVIVKINNTVDFITVQLPPTERIVEVPINELRKIPKKHVQRNFPIYHFLLDDESYCTDAEKLTILLKDFKTFVDIQECLSETSYRVLLFLYETARKTLEILEQHKGKIKTTL